MKRNVEVGGRPAKVGNANIYADEVKEKDGKIYVLLRILGRDDIDDGEPVADTNNTGTN